MKLIEHELPNPGALQDEFLIQHQKLVQQLTRLPCRGCLASCKNYQVCDGKLWRMNQ